MDNRSNEKNLRLLQKIPFFTSLKEEELRTILPFLEEKQTRKGEILFHEGEPGRRLYLIRMGQVKVFKLSEGGKEKILRVFGPGDFFAELPLLDGGNYPASAEALSAATLLSLSRKNFLDILKKYPVITGKIYEIVGNRLRHFTTVVTDLTLKDASRRLAGFLLEKAAQQVHLSQGQVRFPLGLTHQEIASLIGTARETVSRSLKQLQSDGIIEIKERYVTVLDRNALRQAAR
ncbi:MAG: Crp/Fnr family transcriptional regulator [Deltaproteobacteria bacterium]|nr:Crp/Fnr family transcriptional regulator [Deltaproteobacteria bacterium]